MNRVQPTRWVAAGFVHASVEDVWQATLKSALNLSDVDKRAMIGHDAPEPFTTTLGKSGEGRTYIVVDKRQHCLTIQGEWWYQGVTSVSSHEYGSLLVYRVYNIATGPGWWIAQLVQGSSHARSMAGHLQQLLNSIGTQLECEAQLINNYT